MGLPRRRSLALLDQPAAFDLELRDDHGLLDPARATYFPSHIHFEGTIRKEMTAEASFTFARSRRESALASVRAGKVAGRAGRAGIAATGSRWTSGPRRISGFNLFFFDDAPSGQCRPPASFEVQVIRNPTREWTPIDLIGLVPEAPFSG